MWTLIRWIWTLADRYGWWRISRIVSWVINNAGTIKRWLDLGYSYWTIFWRIWGIIF